MSATEPALLSLSEVAKAIVRKQASSREVTQSCLDRITRWQPRLNAFMAIEPDQALAAADAADAALASGDHRGALHGVPLAHKDMYYDAGKVVTKSSKIRGDWVSASTATARCSRLKDAGTVRRWAFGADGRVCLWADRPQRARYGPVRNARGLSATSPAVHHRDRARRLRQASDLRRAGFGHRRFDPDAGAFLRRCRD